MAVSADDDLARRRELLRYDLVAYSVTILEEVWPLFSDRIFSASVLPIVFHLKLRMSLLMHFRIIKFVLRIALMY